MKRAALYARVSTELQEKEQTIQSQLAALHRSARERGFHTTAALTYTDEGYSGSHLERPALDELRDHAREGRFDIVVVLCPDRLARKHAYQVLLIEELKRAGVDIYFCERPISDSPDDQLLLQIQGAIAEYERAKILERARRGHLHRARMGEIGFALVPYGYRRVAKKHGGDGHVRIQEEEAAMVRQIFAWYAEEGMTLGRVVQRLNASTWTPRSGAAEWSHPTVLHLLRREWYIGKAYYNQKKTLLNPRPVLELPSQKTPRYRVTRRPKSEWIEIPVPALVEESLFRRVQERLQENRRFARRRLKHEGVFLLKGLLKCGGCGRAFVGDTKIPRRRDGAEPVYHYYVCPLQSKITGSRRCTNDRLRAAGANYAVWMTIRDLLLDSDTLARELSAWAEQASTPASDSEARRQKIEARLTELSRQRDRLTDAYQTDAIPLDLFRPRMHMLEEQRLQAELALAELRSQRLELEVAQRRSHAALDVVAVLRPKLLTADFDTQQKLLRLLVQRIVVTGQHLDIHLALPLSSNFGLTLSGVGRVKWTTVRRAV
jgi:site-specific DNA recombinase